MHGVIVKKSKVEGHGVFAARDFKKGDVVLRWDDSHTLTSDEEKKLTEHEKRYIAHLNGKCIVMQPPERYVNHSCEANTYARDFCDFAKRDIRKGEEIFADYAETGNPSLNMRCKCGCKCCRKVIRMKNR